MLADVAGDHIVRNGQHANHGDVDREAPVQIKAVSVRRHSRAAARTRLVFLPALALGALLAFGGVLTSKVAAAPTSTAHEGKGPSMPARESFVRPRVILKAKDEIVRIGAPIAVELTLENTSDSEQRLRTGFGPTTATHLVLDVESEIDASTIACPDVPLFKAGACDESASGRI